MAPAKESEIIRRLDPRCIKPSPWANRHSRSFLAVDFQHLKASVAATGGNLQAIKVRPVQVTDAGAIVGSQPEFEIVFGHRRHRACLELGLLVSVVVHAMSDRELFVEMDRENRTQRPLSPYEQGCMFRQALDNGLYESARALADGLHVDAGLVSKSLSIAKLPTEVIDAFVSPLDIQYRWAGPLNDANRLNPAALITRAQLLKMDQGKLTSVRVFQRLVAKPQRLPEGVTIAGRKNQASINIDKKGCINIVVDPPWDARWPSELEKLLREMVESLN
jgi:ParB family chromosome partitioning protein